jgi:hypothetical protein
VKQHINIAAIQPMQQPQPGKICVYPRASVAKRLKNKKGLTALFDFIAA